MTPPLSFKGNALTLNVAVKPGGELQVGLLDEAGNPVPGLTPADCVPITGDHIRQRVTWTSNASLAAYTTRPVCLVFRMTKANLFAFQFTDSD